MLQRIGTRTGGGQRWYCIKKSSYAKVIPPAPKCVGKTRYATALVPPAPSQFARKFRFSRMAMDIAKEFRVS